MFISYLPPDNTYDVEFVGDWKQKKKPFEIKPSGQKLTCFNVKWSGHGKDMNWSHSIEDNFVECFRTISETNSEQLQEQF